MRSIAISLLVWAEGLEPPNSCSQSRAVSRYRNAQGEKIRAKVLTRDGPRAGLGESHSLYRHVMVARTKGIEPSCIR